MLEPDTLVHGRYRIVRHVGQGGMGAVYEAFDVRLHNKVALKQTLVTDENLRHAFEREAQLMARLRHPALPKVIDHFTDEGGQFLVMEYMPGYDLWQQLEKQKEPFTVHQVLDWADQLLDALHYIHTQPSPVIHRDIKPHNLKPVTDTQIALLDFGLAKGTATYETQASTTGSRSTYGYTPQYAPLEQVRGSGTDPRSDLYSLAATMYCLLTAEPPPSSLERASALVSNKPDPLHPPHERYSEVPPALSNVIMQAMSLDPEGRPASAQEMRQQLRTIRQQLQATPATPATGTTISHRAAGNQTVSIPGTQTGTPPPAGTVPPAPPAPPASTSSSKLWLIIGGGVGGVLLLIVLAALFFVFRPVNGTTGEGIITPTTAGGGVETTVAIAPLSSPTTTEGSTAEPTEPTEPAEPTEPTEPTVNPAAETDAQTATAAEAEAEAQAATAEAEAEAEADAQTATADARAQTAIAQAEDENAKAQEQVQTATATAQTARAIETVEAELPQRADLHFGNVLGDASSNYVPVIETLMLEQGYVNNIVSIGGRSALRPSQTGVSYHTWARDIDYAMSGYSYILGDMGVLRDNLLLFLENIDGEGVVPETINQGSPINSGAWDSMPNVIHATYVYVAKTGDRDFYRTHRDALQRAGMWIVRLDGDGNNLPDRDIYPYGYYNSIENSVMHTYALAKFYAAFLELAELDSAIGFSTDSDMWQQRATRLREGFHRPFEEGGYWLDDLPWPVAWRNTDGTPVEILETFGVFEAVRSGLIGPDDGQRYYAMMEALHESLPEMLDTPTPMRLALGGYPDNVLRTDPYVPPWKLDASAPWVVGIAAPVYANAGYPEDARTLVDAYIEMARENDGKVLQLAAGENARYGPGEDSARGLTWDSAAWFQAIYDGHYGITFTPFALFVQPDPYQLLPDDGVTNLTYQGAVIDISLETIAQSYRITSDRQVPVVFGPVGSSEKVVVEGVNDDNPLEQVLVVLEPGQEYVAESVDQ